MSIKELNIFETSLLNSASESIEKLF